MQALVIQSDRRRRNTFPMNMYGLFSPPLPLPPATEEQIAPDLQPRSLRNLTFARHRAARLPRAVIQHLGRPDGRM